MSAPKTVTMSELLIRIQDAKTLGEVPIRASLGSPEYV